MAQKKAAVLFKYTKGGYRLELPDGSEFETDTVPEAMKIARDEGCTRVHSGTFPERYTLLTREDA